MPVRGLSFEDRAPVVRSDPHRMDIACFAGFVNRKPALPPALADWLNEQGWLPPGPYARAEAADLLDVPVPIDSWEAFDRLFEWDRRPVFASSELATSYLGAAVRSFFAEGGRKCYVIRVADCNAAGAEPAASEARLAALVPGYPDTVEASASDRHTWRGAAHILGLPDVTFLCLPDLPELAASAREPFSLARPLAAGREQFVECGRDHSEDKTADRLARLLPPPRSDAEGYGRWAHALSLVLRLVAQWRREVQLVAAVPLPQNGWEPAQLAALLANPRKQKDGLGSAFLQLCYPWLRTRGSGDLPGGLVPPDGALAGLLARTALTRGAFRSAASLRPADIHDLAPALSRRDIDALVDRVSLFGFRPGGPRLLSDATATHGDGGNVVYRPGAVNRLVSLLLRAARGIGEIALFEPSNERTWNAIATRMSDLLHRLWERGALDGATAAQAFEVRCDRTTISQNDIDNGRVIVEVRFRAAAPIEGITVVLAFEESGQVQLVSQETRSATA